MRERFWYEVKVVKTNKAHKCCACEEIIPKGSRALVESGKNKEEGFFTNYFHTNDNWIGEGAGRINYGCHDEYIDCCFANIDTTKKIKDPNFFGQISYEHWKEETDLKVLEEKYGKDFEEFPFA